ncbi:MAG: NADPH-dependent FMN reductase [Conexivisphaera sp.]
MAGSRVRVLGIPGSTRSVSYNRMLLLNVLRRLPGDVDWRIEEVGGMPLLNEDELDRPPARVLELKEAIAEADLVVISTPEHNHSVPSALKNAIDWVSRPRAGNPFEFKPVAIMSASTGMLGGIRAQEHLRQILASLGAIVIAYPEVVVGNAASKFDGEGRLLDAAALRFADELLGNALRVARALRAGLEEAAAEDRRILRRGARGFGQ